MEQYEQESSHPSQLQSSQHQTEDVPLSSDKFKDREFDHSPNIRTVDIHKRRYTRKKCASFCHHQKKVISIILCVIVVLLLAINHFTFGTLQVNNETKLFSTLSQNKSQLAGNQSRKVRDERLESAQQNLSKKQYVPTSTTFDSQKEEYMAGQLQVNLKPTQNNKNSEKEALSQANLVDKKAGVATEPTETFEIRDKPVEKGQPAQKQKVRLQSQKVKPKNMKTHTKKNIIKPIRLGGKPRPKRRNKYNILNKIPKNPYVAQNYSMISKADVRRASRWRVLASQYYNTNSNIAGEQLSYYMQKYSIDQYAQLPFCIVIPTLNNFARRRAEKNIKSVLMQNYTNYRVMIIDDGSIDGTPQFLQGFLMNQNVLNHSQYAIKKNKHRQFALPNVLNAAKTFCHPQDIFIVLDGDDQLLGKQVLKLFNAVFQKEKIWFMYTNFISSLGTLGYSRPYPPEIMKNNAYRDYGFTVTHLRAYYTQLLLNIREEDLQDQKGNYFTAAGDMAIVMPCLQQAHQRVRYVPQITYLYNINTGQNVHAGRLEQQRKNNLKIRSKSRYLPLENLF